VNRSQIAAVGPAIRDIIYVKNEGDKQTYLVGARGGGSIWNALANARANGARTKALVVCGDDEAANLCINDLRSIGVGIEGVKLLREKATRTIHETVTYKGIEGSKPIHNCSSICPVCLSRTYDKSTAKLSKKIMAEFKQELTKNAAEGFLIHIDSFNKIRFDAIKPLRKLNTFFTLDLGRAISLRHTSEEDVLEVLNNIDVLFVNSKLLQKLKQKAGVHSEEELFERGSFRLLVSLRGEKGITAWLRFNKEIVPFDQHAANTDYLLDTSGAGDAFIGFFLSKISQIPFRDLIAWFERRDEVEEVLWLSQKWAARKCGFIGARGHIKDINNDYWNLDTVKNRLNAMNSVEKLKLKNEGLTNCHVCGSFLPSGTQASINATNFHKNVLSLPSRLERGWLYRNETPWSKLFELFGPGYVIGTGGSFVAATFIAQLISSVRKSVVMPLRPFDFIRTGSPTSYAIFISNSGKTPDILGAIQHAKNIGIPQLLFISGGKKPDIIKILREGRDTLLHTGASAERGFLSVFGVVAPCFFAWAALSDEIWNDDNGYRSFNNLFSISERRVNRSLSKFREKLKNKRKSQLIISERRIIILGGGFAWPAMLDLESKMVESNLGRPQVSEIKDYSHGRFVSSMDQGVIAIVCGMPDDKEYREFLVDRLQDLNDVIEINSDERGSVGSLDLILQAEHLMKVFSERSDISKPKIPPRGIELYEYENILESDPSK
jgi:sugar/nucleoside kinase (ribokinase family)/fructoselysine-6-P-deglycase FrlB-like protein